MLIELGVAGTLYALSYVYHRYIEHTPKPPRDAMPPLQAPTTEAGAAIPLVFGRCRVRQPILAWRGHIYSDTGSGPSTYPVHTQYATDMLFVAGIGMGNGATRGSSLSGNKLHNVWWGDRKLEAPAELPIFDSTMRFGQMVTRLDENGVIALRGAYYWHGGWTDQSLTSPASRIGDVYGAWKGDSTLVPGLAKQMLVSFTKLPEDSLDPYFDQTVPDVGGSFGAQPNPDNGFVVGQSPSVSTVSFEVSSYGDIVSGVSGHIFSMTNPATDFGGDADPAEVIYDILTGTYGKLGLPTSVIDLVSFKAASQTLKSEGNGYSRCFDSIREAGEYLEEVLEHIDGVIRLNQKTRLIELKLIRPDFSPTSIPTITRKNCSALKQGAMSGWSNIVNKVRVVFPNRELDYEDDSEAAQNPGNVDGGQVSEEVIHYPGCTRAALAQDLAARELAWRSKPLMKMTAHVDRSFLRVQVGDPVRVNWTKPSISNVVFRVASVNHGTLEDGEIILGLVQDVNYVWRNSTPQAPKLPVIGDPKKIKESGF
jgi:hypothetical protein